MSSGLLNRAFNKYKSDGFYSLFGSSINYMRSNLHDALLPKIQQLKLKYKYGEAAPKSHNTIYVDPDEIQYMLVPALRYDYPRAGTYVLDGNWDRKTIINEYFSTKDYKKCNDNRALLTFSDYDLYTSMKRRYLDDVPWEDTEWYQYYVDNIQETQYESVAEIDEKFRSIDNLYNKIKENGYKSQEELNSNKKYANTFAEVDDEILVDIGRDGRLLFEDGRHRLAIAKILGLEKIPVQVLVRHAEWQKMRKKVYEQRPSTTSIDTRTNEAHPDLKQMYE